MSTPSSRTRGGFTLVELLVVIATIGILAALLLPTLSAAQAKARKTACISNLRQLGIAIHNYAADAEGDIPYGPTAPPFSNPSDFYPATGTVTSLISLQDGEPVGLGLLLGNYIAAQPKVLFCPGSDQPVDADAQLANVGAYQAQSGYFYRHAGTTALSNNATNGPPTHLLLDNLGDNRNGLPIRALALDTEYLAPPALTVYGVKSSTHHARQFVNVLFADGHAGGRRNDDGRFTVNVLDYTQILNSFSLILQALETADAEP